MNQFIHECLRCKYIGTDRAEKDTSSTVHLQPDETVVVCPKCGSEDYYIYDEGGNEDEN